MLATVQAATLLGVRGSPVRVEVHVSNGIPGLNIVGLPDASCREARDRVRAAVITSGFKWGEFRVTVNLAPSAIRKVGSGLDLAIAVGFLRATKQVPNPECGDDSMAFLGELGLDGTLRQIVGVVPLAACIETPELVVPPRNAREAQVLSRHRVLTAESLGEVVACLKGDSPWSVPGPMEPDPTPPPPDLADVRGNRFARFALEVAAAGGHHLLYVGPPGSGKTMLAERMPGVLGRLSADEAIDVTTVHSAAGETLPANGLIEMPPFRAPHHTVSNVALVGGGSHALRPGEISLAHNGVLFLDELGEFSAVALDALRQPLESGVIHISRAHASAAMPASFQLIAAMNPCPCGFAGARRQECRCTPAALNRYSRRLSGPLLDRFDLRLRVEPTDTVDLLSVERGEPTVEVAERVAKVRERSARRGARVNRLLSSTELDRLVGLEAPARELLDDALASGRLSGRGLRRIKSVGLTLDDLRGGDGTLDAGVIAHALSLRADLRFGEAAVLS